MFRQCSVHFTIYDISGDEISLFYREVTQVSNVFTRPLAGWHWRPNHCVIFCIVGKNHHRSYNLWQEICMEVPRILCWEGYILGVSSSYHNPLERWFCPFGILGKPCHFQRREVCINSKKWSSGLILNKWNHDHV